MLTALFLSHTIGASILKYALVGGIAGGLGSVVGSILAKYFKKEKLFNTVLLIFIIVSFQIPRLIETELRKNSENVVISKEERLLSINIEAAKALRSRLPMKVDDLTSMVDVKGEKDGIYYFYQVQTNPEILAETEKNPQLIKGVVVQQACKNPNTLAFLNADDVYHYHYKDQFGKEFLTFSVNKNDCKI